MNSVTANSHYELYYSQSVNCNYPVCHTAYSHLRPRRILERRTIHWLARMLRINISDSLVDKLDWWPPPPPPPHTTLTAPAPFLQECSFLLPCEDIIVNTGPDSPSLHHFYNLSFLVSCHPLLSSPPRQKVKTFLKVPSKKPDIESTRTVFLLHLRGNVIFNLIIPD